MHTAFHASPDLAHRDFLELNREGFRCDDIQHDIDRSKPLPPIAPRTGQSPVRLLSAILDRDLYALTRELTQPGGAPVNDPIPGQGMKGRTVLHVVARLYALCAGGWSAADRQAADILNQMTNVLLASGADPCARDGDYELPAGYAPTGAPPALRQRMEREAADARFDDENPGKAAWFPFNPSSADKLHRAKLAMRRKQKQGRSS